MFFRRLCFYFLAHFFLIWTGSLSAHEVRPALMEFQISETQPNQLELQLGMTAEIFLSGLDAAVIQDTNDSDRAVEYDQLRARSPEWLREEMNKKWPELASHIQIENGGRRLPLKLQSIQVETGLSLSQIRQTDLSFSASEFDPGQPVYLSWSSQLGPLIVRQATKTGQNNDRPLFATFLQSGQKAGPIFVAAPEPQPLLEIIGHYIYAGILHIVPYGLDHILFVLGLFLFSMSGRILLVQISLFTLAHTLTLALASLNIVRVSADWVEPLIALSIAYVAFEILWADGRMRATRAVLIFCFGLLHGLGFASVLADFGLPDSAFIPALISFNIGVECGQLLIVGPVFILLVLLRPDPVPYRKMIQIPASVIIGLTGVYWTMERLGLLAF